MQPLFLYLHAAYFFTISIINRIMVAMVTPLLHYHYHSTAFQNWITLWKLLCLASHSPRQPCWSQIKPSLHSMLYDQCLQLVCEFFHLLFGWISVQTGVGFDVQMWHWYQSECHREYKVYWFAFCGKWEHISLNCL